MFTNSYDNMDIQDDMPVDLDYTKHIRVQMNVPERIFPVRSSQHSFDQANHTALNQPMIIPDKLIVTGAFEFKSKKYIFGHLFQSNFDLQLTKVTLIILILAKIYLEVFIC